MKEGEGGGECVHNEASGISAVRNPFSECVDNETSGVSNVHLSRSDLGRLGYPKIGHDH